MLFIHSPNIFNLFPHNRCSELLTSMRLYWESHIRGVIFPLLYKLLLKRGSSKTDGRKEISDRYESLLLWGCNYSSIKVKNAF